MGLAEVEVVPEGEGEEEEGGGGDVDGGAVFEDFGDVVLEFEAEPEEEGI